MRSPPDLSVALVVSLDRSGYLRRLVFDHEDDTALMEGRLAGSSRLASNQP